MGNYKTILSRGISAICLVLAAACGGGGTPNISAQAPSEVAPSFTQQPSPQNVTDKDPVTFSVRASGSPAPSFAWQEFVSDQWTPIEGATLATYQFKATLAKSGTLYRAIATNAKGSATSNTAMLTVLTAPAILGLRGEPTSIHAGDGARLTWMIQNAGSLSMDQGIGDLSGRASVWVKPAATTTYTLTAMGSMVTASITVNVTPGAGSKQWVSKASPTTQRISGSTTLLADGRILMAGGFNDGIALSSAEIYDPARNTWSPAAPLSTARGAQSARLLPDGRVLVAGGTGQDSDSPTLSSSEIYDPARNTWSPAASLNQARWGSSNTLLASGKVLVAGGVALGGTVPLASVEVYDAVNDTWTLMASLREARVSHSATLLPDGRVLVVGGNNNGSTLASVELYNPALDTWTSAASLKTARRSHGAALLADGKLLVAGGTGGWPPTFEYLASAELYDPATDNWGPAPSMRTARWGHATLLLADGTVLAVGGYNPADGYLASVERYDPDTKSWSDVASLNGIRLLATARLLADGKLVVVGRANADVSILSTEIYDY